MSSPSTPTDALRAQRDMQRLIGNTLRIGVTTACLIALIGGLLYLLQHGGEPMKDYTTFAPANADTDDATLASYTTLHGIIDGLCRFTAVGWIQCGVLVLLLTPILRVALSLVDFLRERDWLYALISAVVLAVILLNSLEGFTGR